MIPTYLSRTTKQPVLLTMQTTFTTRNPNAYDGTINPKPHAFTDEQTHEHTVLDQAIGSTYLYPVDILLYKI